MKFSLRLGDAENLTRENALACCSLNLVVPGGGSLLAGRRVGYAQLVLGLLGFALTLIFGLRFVIWGMKHLPELRDPSGDPAETLLQIWRGCRWALAGLGLFGMAWLWAFVTNLGIMQQTRRPSGLNEKPPVIR